MILKTTERNSMHTVWEDGTVMTRNSDWQSVPAIPLPLYIYFGCRCGDCKAWFWKLKSYRGHYALKHILKI
jgi:hypothetical protein